MKRVPQRIARAVRYGRTLGHVRHYRGHGVHSPFVYRVVREVVMRKREILGDDKALFVTLRSMGVSRKRSAQLQNFYSMCGCGRYVVDNEWFEQKADGVMWIISKRAEPAMIANVEQMIDGHRMVVCVVYPRSTSKRYKATRRAIGEHHGLSIDSIGFVVLMCNDNRLKQHICI